MEMMVVLGFVLELRVFCELGSWMVFREMERGSLFDSFLVVLNFVLVVVLFGF